MESGKVGSILGNGSSPSGFSVTIDDVGHGGRTYGRSVVGASVVGAAVVVVFKSNGQGPQQPQPQKVLHKLVCRAISPLQSASWVRFGRDCYGFELGFRAKKRSHTLFEIQDISCL